MLQKLVMLLIICSLLGGLSGAFALLLVFSFKDLSFQVTSSQIAMLIVAPLVLTVIIAIVLTIVLRTQKHRADQFITDPDWRKLPDNDL